MTNSPFAVKDCALIAIATGRRATTCAELLDHLRTVDGASVYYHFWGGLLQPRFEEREFNNDFAAWARHELHDGPSPSGWRWSCSHRCDPPKKSLDRPPCCPGVKYP